MKKITLISPKRNGRPISDKIFKIGATVAGVYVLVMVALLAFQLISESYPVWEENGLSFIVKTEWNAVDGREDFGALPYIFGTLITSGMAMVIGVPLSIGIAMFIS
ncbi:MAG: phosphate ABC transporter permease subunit PstC, partial [Nitrosarchaeum sp.]|nr:phosphate ABC transporter permease subunit PstC [Nitrosarchaeum sp.]